MHVLPVTRQRHGDPVGIGGSRRHARADPHADGGRSPTARRSAAVIVDAPRRGRGRRPRPRRRARRTLPPSSGARCVSGASDRVRSRPSTRRSRGSAAHRALERGQQSELRGRRPRRMDELAGERLLPSSPGSTTKTAYPSSASAAATEAPAMPHRQRRRRTLARHGDDVGRASGRGRHRAPSRRRSPGSPLFSVRWKVTSLFNGSMWPGAESPLASRSA
jgi:hypothetical protein